MKILRYCLALMIIGTCHAQGQPSTDSTPQTILNKKMSGGSNTISIPFYFDTTGAVLYLWDQVDTSSQHDLFLGYNAGTGTTTAAILANCVGTYTCGALGVGMTGAENTAMGWESLSHATTAQYDSSFGVNALGAETTGYYNTAIGEDSQRDTVGNTYTISVGSNSDRTMICTGCTAIGAQAMFGGSGITPSSATILYATAVGFEALQSQVTSSGSYNTAIGASAMASTSMTTANYETALGFQALQSDLSGVSNTAVGVGALKALTSGTDSVAVGFNALSAQIASNYNVAVGFNAGATTTAGHDGTFIGTSAGSNSTGSSNVAVGSTSMTASTAGVQNTFVGAYSGRNTTNNNNTCIGELACGTTLVGGGGNIAIGQGVDTIGANTNNEVTIGGALVGYNVTTGISCSATYCGTGGGTIGGSGTFFFTITEGSGTPANPEILTMPAAPNDWDCTAQDRTSTLTAVQANTTASTTAPSLKFYTPLGVATAPSAGDLVDVKCLAR